MPDALPEIYFPDTKAKAVFASDGPRPQFLMDTSKVKAVVVGLEPRQQIPLHSDETAIYHILEGTGLMTVGDETFAIGPGVTVVAPGGTARGVNAKTRLIFLGFKGN